jgi:DNA-binding CsgD family transcriptional regulator
VPGTAPRQSSSPAAAGFSALGRLILDRLDRGVVLLDPRRRVRDANTLARRVIGDGNGVRVRGGRFAFTDAALDGRLSKMIEAYVDGRDDDLNPIAAQVRHGSSPPYRVVVAPVPSQVDTRPIAFVVLIYGPLQRRDIPLELLGEVYGLTPAQAEVARSLYAGHSVEETAAALGLSPNTVRTHLKAIFTRCEVKSQRELLHLLASGPVEF